MSIDTPRTEYSVVRDFDLRQDPFEMFRSWYALAQSSGIMEPNAMALATVDKESHPSVRMVLMKEFDDDGLCFFTNLNSQKAQHISANANVSSCFYWESLHRQVRISGIVEQLPRSRVDNYFKSRPRGAQVGAWISEQSQILQSPESLQEAYNSFEKLHGAEILETPEHWGGFQIVPQIFEFWQGASNRLHKRIRFNRAESTAKGLSNGSGQWNHCWIYP